MEGETHMQEPNKNRQERKGEAPQTALTTDQQNRYSRQILLNEMGEEGQLKLLRSRVLIVGAGGLGSPIALYLAGAGIGTLGIVDSDLVDLSNLHRQILHATTDIGRPKTESARESMGAINPDIVINTYHERLTAHNGPEIMAGYDIIVEGSDNFATKFLLNDAAFFSGKPYVFGGAVRFDGQASVFFPKSGGPCLRCMIPEIPPASASLTCSQVGVLGIVAGQVGLIEAAEVVKLILGKGDPLVGRFLAYSCLDGEFRTFTVPKNPDCPLCSEKATIKDLSGYYGAAPE